MRIGREKEEETLVEEADCANIDERRKLEFVPACSQVKISPRINRGQLPRRCPFKIAY